MQVIVIIQYIHSDYQIVTIMPWRLSYYSVVLTFLSLILLLEMLIILSIGIFCFTDKIKERASSPN